MPKCATLALDSDAGLIAETALIRLTVRGWPPLEGGDQPHDNPPSPLTIARQSLRLSPSRHPPWDMLAPAAAFRSIGDVRPCSFRYLTSPNRAAFASSLALSETVAAPPTAVHLRTSFADAWNESGLLLRYGAPLSTKPSAAAASHWLDAACPSTSARAGGSGGGGGTWLETIDANFFSDSPGLIRELQRRRRGRAMSGRTSSSSSRGESGSSRRDDSGDEGGGSGCEVGSSDAELSLNEMTTRSWNAPAAATRKALADLVIAGLSTHLYVAPQLHMCPRLKGCEHHAEDPHSYHWSGFFIPLLLRSFCTERVALAVPGCKRYPAIFVRDLPGHLHGSLGPKPGFRWRIMQHQIPAAHPCKRMRQPDRCYRHWVAALL